MNYKIILDENELKSFIDFLPELKPTEKYYVSLFARKKYSSVVSSDKAQLKRFTSDKKYLFNKIKQLECEVGSYTLNDVAIPQEALALYISINPRDMYKSSLLLLADLANKIANNNIIDNPHSVALNIIHKTTSKGDNYYFDLDIDIGDENEIPEYIERVKGCFTNPDEVLKFIRTRGGLHILVKVHLLNNTDKKNWFNKIRELPYVDMAGDNLIPVIGCTQGGFMPHFIK